MTKLLPLGTPRCHRGRGSPLCQLGMSNDGTFILDNNLAFSEVKYRKRRIWKITGSGNKVPYFVQFHTKDKKQKYFFGGFEVLGVIFGQSQAKRAAQYTAEIVLVRR